MLSLVNSRLDRNILVSKYKKIFFSDIDLSFSIMTQIQETVIPGSTGEVLTDLPSPYIPHENGLMHLPRFIAKIKKHLKGELPKSYQRNFTKGFDGFLCLHLGIDPKDVIALVREAPDEKAMNASLQKIFPSDLKVEVWNRKLVQMGMSEMGREALADAKAKMGISSRGDIISFADMIEIDEGRIQ